MKTNHIIVTSIALLFAKNCFAENLLDVYEDASNFDKTYLSAKRQQEAELEKLVQSRANLLPRINATANKSEIRQVPFGGDTSTTFETDGYGLELRQTLFDSGVFNQYRQAKLAAQLSQLELVNIEQDLIVRVAQAYFAALQSQQDLALANSNLESAESQLNQVKKRFEVGLANNTEYQQSLSRSKSAYTAQLQAQVALQKFSRELETITGTRYPVLADLLGDLSSETLYETPNSGWLTDVLKNNIAYQQEKLRLDIANKEVKVQRAEHLPKIEFAVNRNNTSIKTGVTNIDLDGGEMQTTASVQLSMPLFLGGRTRSKIREAKKLRQAADENLHLVSLNVVNQAQELLDNTKIFKPSIEALEEAVIASQQVLDARREGFKAGLESNLDVLDAQRDLFQVSLDANQLRYSAVLLGLQLQEINGSLTKSDLEEINNSMLEKTAAENTN